MFSRQRGNISEREESSDNKIVNFRKKVINRISSSSVSDIEEAYTSEDLEDMLEEFFTDEEEEMDTIDDSLNNIQWNEFANRQQTFSFTGKSELLMDLPFDISASEVFSLFADEKVISLLVTETNRYAEEKLHQRWKRTTSKEIIKFIELMVWMDLVQVPLVKYWSTHPFYNFSFPRSRMSRNRFGLILANLHFANNETIEPSSRLGKLLPLVNILIDNYQKIFSPGEDIVVDETMVPWKGQLIFRQYIPTKSHKYGIKLLKLCSTEGYTSDNTGSKLVGS